MSPQHYILKEKKIMEKECRRKGISPDEWISKHAVAYHNKYAHKVLAHCFEGYN